MDWQIDKQLNCTDAIPDDLRIPATSVSLGNSIYFWTWTRQKSVPVEKLISKGLENACRLFFDWKMHFANDCLSEFCFLPTRGQQFCKTASTIFVQKIAFFDPQVASKRVFCWHFICSCRSFGRSDRNFFASGAF